MDKTEKLLRMTEHPEQYSEEEWQEILADEECLALYEAMSLSTSAFEAADAQEKTADGLKEEEWKKFEARQFAPKRRSWSPMQAAATIVGVMMLAGIAYAAIHHWTATPQNPTEKNTPTEQQTMVTDTIIDSLKTVAPVEEQATGVRIFENTPLDEMATEIASFYHKEADIRSHQVHDIRLFYKWDREDSLESVVSDLNHFDRVNLVIEGMKLIVKP
ncbi:MAG: DUF4974 domain-containing protein [Prevotella sp.]|nr:DUF4974 domain-containing protein [Prevotella sp.]